MPRASAESRRRLAAALFLLSALVVAGVLTSTPQRSAAGTWVTWAWQLRYGVFPVTEPSELAGIHSRAYLGTREQCVGCHGDMAGSALPVHRIHLGSELLKYISCHECHQRVDLSSRSGTAAATWVDVGFCKKCHSAFPGLEPGSHMHSEDFEADCMMCHTGEHSIKHAQPYLPQLVPASACRGCHGGRVLPWTAGHEQADWLTAHGAEALRAGTGDCFACHDFGLKFCDDCHAKKPPSHLPAEQWRALHPDTARADTRVCYTCHETAYCKKCHVNHETGWMTTHPAFVTRRGSSSCTECHSLSSCAYCHTAHAENATAESASP